MTMQEQKQNSTDENKPDPIDIYVGVRLRQRRTLVGMSQNQLGQAIGLTFQQVQKYERGTNRVGASRLYNISRLLNVSVNYFFEGLHEASLAARAIGFAEDGQESLEGAPGLDKDIMHRRETLELVRTYYKISDPKKRRKLLELVRSMVDEQ